MATIKIDLAKTLGTAPSGSKTGTQKICVAKTPK